MTITNTQGTKFARGDGASPEVFTNATQVLSITGLEAGQRPVIEVSNLDSSVRGKRGGLRDAGQVTVTVQKDKNDPVQVAMDADYRANPAPVRNWRVTLPDSPPTVYTFAAYVASAGKDVVVDSVLGTAYVLEATDTFVET